MHAKHKFFKTRNGITSFAVVSVRSEVCPAWSTTWAPTAVPFQQVYSDAVKLGVQRAAEEHEKRGGAPHLIEVISIEDAPSDARLDAVTCAAAVAAWKSLGRAENDIYIDVDDEGRWRVTFVSQSLP